MSGRSQALPASTGWALSIYSSRESPEVLAQTVRHAVRALARCGGGVVDVVVNGRAELAGALAEHPAATGALPRDVRLRVWSLATGDKACAWNQYIHRIAPVPAGLYVFMDGYVHVDEQAVERLGSALLGAAEALAATGLPSVGASAAKIGHRLRADGGLHGNLYALKAEALGELRRIGFRLPLGLYRNDSTLGAALSFGLNVHPRAWDARRRIVLVPEARWSLTPLRWWRPAHWRSHFRRLVRQAQGDLEVLAVRDRYAVRRLPFEQLPRTALELVNEWTAGSSDAARRAARRGFLTRRALLELAHPRDWSDSESPPRLVLDRPGTAPVEGP